MFCTVCTSAQKTLIQLYSVLCECRAKNVSISLGDVSYQWSKATALNFSQEVSYLTTALSLCLFSFEVRYQDIVATAKKGQSLQRHVVFRQNLIHFHNIEQMVIAKLKWETQVCDTYSIITLCWRNLRNILEYRGILHCRVSQGGRELWDLLESR